MTPPRPGDFESVLGELGWLRGLARDLCADPHTADDAVQDTVAAALLHRPDQGQPQTRDPQQDPPPVRGWLATVLVNALRSARRTHGRRAAREQLLARAEATPSAAELAERVELQRSLLLAVQALPEPLRAAVQLRYLEGLPPRRIAAMLQVPVATVKSRLQRGLAELRLRLDRGHGGRRAWIAVFARIDALIGAIAMSNKVLFGSAAAVAALAIACVQFFGDSPASVVPTEPGRAPQAAAVAAAEKAASVPDEPAADSVARTLVETPASPPAPAAPGIRGIVIDVKGARLAAVRVRGGGAEAETDGEGRFVLPSEGGGAWITVDAPGWTNVLQAAYKRGPRDSIVVAAPAVRVQGRVVDETRGAIASARLELKLPEGLRGSLPLVLDDSNEVDVQTEADAQGEFALPEVPAVEGARLQVAAAGYQTQLVPLPLGGDPALVVTLKRPAPTAATLTGTVLDAEGRRAGGAIVVLGHVSATTAADGSFTLDLARVAAKADTIAAVRPGSLPARLQATGRDAEGRALWPQPLVLQLGGPALHLAGRVLRDDGEPAAGIRVWVNGLSPLGGRVQPNESSAQPCMAENEMRGVKPGWNPVNTGADGSFRIDGLCQREYHITAMDPATVRRVDLEHVAAGRDDLVLRFDARDVLPKFHGRVVDRAGAGIAGVHVNVTTDCFHQSVEGFGSGTWHDTATPVATDEEGRFAIEAMPKQRAYLRFDGDLVLSRNIGQDGYDWVPLPGQELRVVMVRRCHFQLELLDPASADEVAMLDVDGKQVTLSEFLGGGSFSSFTMKIRDGRTSTLATVETAQTLVLYRDDKEVRRVPVVLVAGERTVLRF